MSGARVARHGLHKTATEIAELACNLGWSVAEMVNGGAMLTNYNGEVHVPLPPVRQWNQAKARTMRNKLFTYGDPQLINAWRRAQRIEDEPHLTQHIEVPAAVQLHVASEPEPAPAVPVRTPGKAGHVDVYRHLRKEPSKKPKSPQPEKSNDVMPAPSEPDNPAEGSNRIVYRDRIVAYLDEHPEELLRVQTIAADLNLSTKQVQGAIHRLVRDNNDDARDRLLVISSGRAWRWLPRGHRWNDQKPELKPEPTPEPELTDETKPLLSVVRAPDSTHLLNQIAALLLPDVQAKVRGLNESNAALIKQRDAALAARDEAQEKLAELRQERVALRELLMEESQQ